jgi:regulator of protease activity HflC (stomatin/prohibitin superfamily)
MVLPNSLLALSIAIVVVLLWLFMSVNILREYERGVVFRLGRVLDREKGPGIVVIFWPIETMVRVSLRVVTWDVPPQDIITRDNVSLKVNAVVYFRVIAATKAIIEVENYRFATREVEYAAARNPG